MTSSFTTKFGQVVNVGDDVVLATFNRRAQHRRGVLDKIHCRKLAGGIDAAPHAITVKVQARKIEYWVTPSGQRYKRFVSGSKPVWNDCFVKIVSTNCIVFKL